LQVVFDKKEILFQGRCKFFNLPLAEVLLVEVLLIKQFGEVCRI